MTEYAQLNRREGNTVKKGFAAVCAVLCAMTFAACGNGNEEVPEEKAAYVEIEASETSAAEEQTVPCSAITEKLLSSVELSSMAEVGADRIGMYLDLTIPENCDFSMYICGSGGFADEIFVIRSTPELSTEDIRAAAEKRIETRKTDFEDYNPDEVEKLENAYIAERNGYFIYAITGDSAVCGSVFDEFVK